MVLKRKDKKLAKTDLMPDDDKYEGGIVTFKTWLTNNLTTSSSQTTATVRVTLDSPNPFQDPNTRDYVEVDIILSKGPSIAPIAIEIKSKNNPYEKDFHALKSFQSENKTAELYCLCTSPGAYKIGDVTVLPWREGLNKFLGV